MTAHAPPFRPLETMVAGVLDAAAWTYYAGFWGNSHPGNFAEQSSPQGPRFQGAKWSAPAQFDAAARPCSTVQHTSSSLAAAAARVRLLKVVAEMTDSRHMRVRYSVAALSRKIRHRAHAILVTGLSASRHTQPRSYGYRVHLRGSLRQDLPLGESPYRVRVQVLDRQGNTLSRTEVAVRG